MSTTTQLPTPECDRHKEQMQIEDADVAYAETLYLAIKLESERDEARKCAEEWREHCLKRHVMSQIVSSKLPWEEKE